MKRRNLKTFTLLVAVILMVAGTDALAQRGRGMAPRGGAGMGQVCFNIPNLTEDQMQDIIQLRAGHLEEMQGYRDQIDVNRIRYRSLIREGADMGAINSNIEERAAIRTQMEKKQAEHHQAIRNILTEDQKTWFDAAPRGGVGFRQAGPGMGRRGGMCPFLGTGAAPGAGRRGGPGAGGAW